jgi:Transposase DDE domain
VRPAAPPPPAVKPSKQQRQKEHDSARKRAFADKESFKWLEALHGVEKALPAEQPVLIIQDREADIFEFVSAPRRANTHLLIRAAQPRRVFVVPVETHEADQESFEAKLLDPKQVYPNVFEVLEAAPVARVDTLEVGRRPDQPAHQVQLALKYVAVRLLPPRSQGRVRSVDQCPRVWLLEAREVVKDETGALVPKPKGLHWVLLCTMPIEEAQQASVVIQYYARRWQIERFHFVLKSGCQVEKLQMDRVSFLQKAMSIYSVVSWL